MAGELVPFLLGASGGVPGLIQMGSWTNEHLRSILHRNTTSFIDMLEKLGRVTPDEITEALNSRPQAVELFVRVVEVASKTQQQKRRRVLAGLVTVGIHGSPDGSPPDFDELFILQAASDRLEDPHVHLLLIMEAIPPRPDAEDPTTQSLGVKSEELATQWPQAANWIPALLGVLVAEGLVEDVMQGTWDGLTKHRYQLTHPGRRLIDYYRLIDPANSESDL